MVKPLAKKATSLFGLSESEERMLNEVPEREPNPMGDRVMISMSGKSLPFKYSGNTHGIPDYGFKED